MITWEDDQSWGGAECNMDMVCGSADLSFTAGNMATVEAVKAVGAGTHTPQAQRPLPALRFS